MGGVGPKELLVAVDLGGEEAGLLELVELEADAVSALPKLGFQVAQVRPGIAVEEELQQQLDAGLRRNEGV